MRNNQKTPRLRVFTTVVLTRKYLPFCLVISLFYLGSFQLFGQLDSLEQRLLTLPEHTERSING